MMNTNSGWHVVPQIFTACFVPGAAPNATGKAKAHGEWASRNSQIPTDHGHSHEMA